MNEHPAAPSDRPPEPPPTSDVDSTKAQRVRLRFARGPEAANIGHLDLARHWEQAFEQAGIPISYSQSKRPRPRLTIAAGLPAGATSDGELLDVILARLVQPGSILAKIQLHLPPGLEAREAWEVGMALPSLPSAVRWADYEVDLPADAATSAAAAIDAFVAADEFQWEDTRREKVRHYDLRPLVQDIRILPADDAGECHHTQIFMRLRCEAARVGRPEQVILALALPQPTRIHRLRLLLADVSPARDAWRRRGRYLS